MSENVSRNEDRTLRFSHSGFSHLICLRGKRLRRLLRTIALWNIVLIVVPIAITVMVHTFTSRPATSPDLSKAVLVIIFLALVAICMPLVVQIHPRILSFSADTFALDRCGRCKTYDRECVESVTIHRCGDKRRSRVVVSVREGMDEATFEITTREDAERVNRQLKTIGYEAIVVQ